MLSNCILPVLIVITQEKVIKNIYKHLTLCNDLVDYFNPFKNARVVQLLNYTMCLLLLLLFKQIVKQ